MLQREYNNILKIDALTQKEIMILDVWFVAIPTHPPTHPSPSLFNFLCKCGITIKAKCVGKKTKEKQHKFKV